MGSYLSQLWKADFEYVTLDWNADFSSSISDRRFSFPFYQNTTVQGLLSFDV